MTKKQKEQFNYMRTILKLIAFDTMSVSQLRRKSQSLYGLDFEEAIEMSYENIQNLAGNAVKGIKEIK